MTSRISTAGRYLRKRSASYQEDEMRKYLTARLRFTIEDGEPMLYCEIKEGKRYKPIAKRPSGKTWINLEPGYAVSGSEPGSDYNAICIDHNPNVGAH
jgi:hypothetical protein